MKKTNYSKPDIVVVKQWDDRQIMPTASGKTQKWRNIAIEHTHYCKVF